MCVCILTRVWIYVENIVGYFTWVIRSMCVYVDVSVTKSNKCVFFCGLFFFLLAGSRKRLYANKPLNKKSIKSVREGKGIKRQDK